jgi:hypothetical protein
MATVGNVKYTMVSMACNGDRGKTGIEMSEMFCCPNSGEGEEVVETTGACGNIF